MNAVNQPLLSYYPSGIMHRIGVNMIPKEYISFADLIALHQSDKLFKRTNKIKAKGYGTEEYKRAKMRLPVVLFNKFAFNTNDGFIEENPIKPFDVDLSSNTPERIERFRREIAGEALCVIGSVGGGVKFFLNIMFDTSCPREYIRKYNAVCDRIAQGYDIVLDKAQGRIKQPYFISYQSDIYEGW